MFGSLGSHCILDDYNVDISFAAPKKEEPIAYIKITLYKKLRASLMSKYLLSRRYKVSRSVVADIKIVLLQVAVISGIESEWLAVRVVMLTKG